MLYPAYFLQNEKKTYRTMTTRAETNGHVIFFANVYIYVFQNKLT